MNRGKQRYTWKNTSDNIFRSTRLSNIRFKIKKYITELNNSEKYNLPSNIKILKFNYEKIDAI